MLPWRGWTVDTCTEKTTIRLRSLSHLRWPSASAHCGRQVHDYIGAYRTPWEPGKPPDSRQRHQAFRRGSGSGWLLAVHSTRHDYRVDWSQWCWENHAV